MTTSVIVAIGSNIPPRMAALREAVRQIGQFPLTELSGMSRVYETKPAGGPPQGLFLNAALSVETSLPPSTLLQELQGVENRLGRLRRGRNFPRTIDLDIIIYGDLTLADPTLRIPHPRFRERGFVLQPLADIIPDFVDPVTNETVKTLLGRWIRKGGRLDVGRSFEET